MRFAVFLLSLVAAASATVFITSPTASSVLIAGQNATIQWMDDGHAPSLAAFGLATFAIYVGNTISQTSVQSIATNVNVSSTNAIVFAPNLQIGPSGPYYFIRCDSLTAKSPTNPVYQAQSFSAKFTLNGATGTFTPAEQAQVNGASSNPVSSSLSTPPSPRVSTSMSSLKVASSSVSAPISKTTSAAVASVSVGKLVGLLIGVVGWAMLL